MRFKEFFIENKLVKDIDFSDVDEYYEDSDPVIEEDDYVKGEELSEKLKKSKVVRGGVQILKLKSDREGYKIVDGKEVKMDPAEVKLRKIGARKAVKKRKAKQSQINRKRAISNKKRSTNSLNTQFKG